MTAFVQTGHDVAPVHDIEGGVVTRSRGDPIRFTIGLPASGSWRKRLAPARCGR